MIMSIWACARLHYLRKSYRLVLANSANSVQAGAVPECFVDLMEPAFSSRTQSVLGALTLAAVLVPVLVLGGNSPIAWSLLAVFVLLVFLGQILLSLFSPAPVSVQKLLLAGLLFLGSLAWAWMQTASLPSMDYVHPYWLYVQDPGGFVSADPGQTRQAVMRLLTYAAIFLISVWTCSDAVRAAVVLKSVAVFSTAVAGYGLYAFATGQNSLLGDAANPSLVQSTFVNRNNYATYAAMGVLANLAAFLAASNQQSDSLRGRIEGFFSGAWIYAIGALVGIGAVSLTQSRAGAIAGLLGLAVFLVALPRGRTRTWDRVMLSLLASVILFITMTSATGLTERLLATDAEEGRFAIYPLVIQGIADRPFLGHGLGAFHEAFRPYIPLEASGTEWRRAHSTYLELAFGLGLPATAAFFTAFGLVFWRIYRGTKVRRVNRVFSCFALGCIVTVAFHSVFDFSLQMPAVAALFAVLLGIGYAQSFTHKETGDADARHRAARNR